MLEEQESSTAQRKRMDFGPLWSLILSSRPSPWFVVVACLSLIVAASAELAIGKAVRNMFDHAIVEVDPSAVNGYFVWFWLVIGGLAASTFGRVLSLTWLAQRVTAEIRKAVYGHLVGLSSNYFDKNKLGDILARLTSDINQIQTVISSTCPNATKSLFVFTGGTVLMFITNVKLSLIIYGLVPFVFLPTVWIGRKVRHLSRQYHDRLAVMTSLAKERLTAIQTVQAFTRESVECRQFDEAVEEALPFAIRRAVARASLIGAVILLMFSLINVSAWIGAMDLLEDRITLGELVAFIIYAFITAMAAGNLSDVWGGLQAASGAAERVVEILDTKPSIVPPRHPVRFPQPAEGRIEFHNVSFRYPSRPDTTVLSDFSLDVEPGETVALVGPSGSGKSTVFKLLLRFYDPQEGEIRMDGVELRLGDPSELRSRISLIAQDPVVFGMDAFENIRYGKLDASEDEIHAAATAAVADQFLDELPDGMRSFLGDRGTQLSGGQRQRLAIARGMLRDSSVMLLDEATSSLDSENERMVHEAIENVTSGRTAIIIAHRLATVQRADRIIVMDGGHIVAEGTHDQLIEQGGLYARFAELQLTI